MFTRTPNRADTHSHSHHPTILLKLIVAGRGDESFDGLGTFVRRSRVDAQIMQELIQFTETDVVLRERYPADISDAQVAHRDVHQGTALVDGGYGGVDVD